MLVRITKKLPKGTHIKAHEIARAIIRDGSHVREPYAVGMAAAKKWWRRKGRKRKDTIKTRDW